MNTKLDIPMHARTEESRAEEKETLNDRRGPRQGAPRAHLVIGPVGSGKSTFALELAKGRGAVRLTLDDWMSRLFSPDRPESGVVSWYVERAARSVEQIWVVAKSVLEAGCEVILEIGLLSRRERAAFYERAADAGIPLTVHVLDAPRDVRRERVEARNREKGATFSMIVPPAIFELASDMWEAPDEGERARGHANLVFVDVT
jgi:predicted kinase